MLPVVETYQTLSLELMTLDITTPAVYTVQGVPLLVEGVAQIKVKGDDTSIITAAEQFLDKTQQQIAEIALHTLEGHLRAIIGTMNVEEIVTNWDAVRAAGAGSLRRRPRQHGPAGGLVRHQGHPRHPGLPGGVGPAEDRAWSRETPPSPKPRRRGTRRSSPPQANQVGQTAKFEADTKIAESDRDYKLKLAEYNASVQQKTAEADLSYDLQKFKTQQLVRQEEVQVQVIEKQKQIEVQEQEILRREKELAATVQKPAEAERAKIQQLAEAEQYRLQTTATGQAEATRAVGIAEADATQGQGSCRGRSNAGQGYGRSPRDGQEGRGVAAV